MHRELLKILTCFPFRSFALLPYRWRFEAMRRLARFSWPVFRLVERSKIFILPLHNYRDLALKLPLYALIRYNIPFKTSLKISPANLLKANSGVLILTCHLTMNRFFIRWLCDQGRRVSAVTINPTPGEYVGWDYPVDGIYPDTKCLFRIRQRIKAGYVVFLPTESLTQTTTHTYRVNLGTQSIYISGKALQFAEKSAIPVLFGLTFISKEGQVVVKLARPSTTHSEIAINEFCQFLSAEFAEFGPSDSVHCRNHKAIRIAKKIS